LGTKEFQDKADIDKLRYLKEQQEFYDEVGRIKGKEEKILSEAALNKKAMEDLEGSAVEDGLPNDFQDGQGGKSICLKHLKYLTEQLILI